MGRNKKQFKDSGSVDGGWCRVQVGEKPTHGICGMKKCYFRRWLSDGIQLTRIRIPMHVVPAALGKHLPPSGRDADLGGCDREPSHIVQNLLS